MKKLAVGVDIGGTNTAIGLVNREGEVAASTSIPTRAYPDPEEFVVAVCQQAKSLSQNLDCELVGSGIGAPNGNHYRGTVEFAPNLSWDGVIPLAKLFSENLGLPSFLDNDANAATAGEMIYGAAQHMTELIMITLGTGVGSGIVVNGRIVRGHDGFAGEIGHTIVEPGGRKCGCGRKGCLETYASATGVKRTIVERLALNNDESTLREIKPDSLNSKVIYEAAIKGDAIAREAFEFTGKMLGTSLANAVAYTGPEAIFIFGGLAKAGPLLFDPLKHHFEENLLAIYKSQVQLLPSALPDFNAAVLGASAMVWRRIESE